MSSVVNGHLIEGGQTGTQPKKENKEMADPIDPILNINPENFKTGIAYARALIEADPSINLNKYTRICHWHGVAKKRGFSKDRFHAAVREWRAENGYPLRPHGTVGKSRAANWLPDEWDGSAADSLEIGSEAPERAESGSEAPPEPQDKGGEAEDARALDGSALAELVWEWMTHHDLEMVAFWDDGEVNVKRNEPKEREYRLVVDGEEA